jgi:hypothetical protein
MRKRVWDENNLRSTEGIEEIMRRGADQQGTYEPVDPQPKVKIIVVDEADPHANERSSYAGQYGVFYCLREDDVQDKDGFWYQPHMDGVPVGQKFWWGIVGAERWNINHALTGTNFGVKQLRVRKGG